MSTAAAEADFHPCRVARLPVEEIIPAAQKAIAIRPENDPHLGPDEGPTRKRTDVVLPPARAAVLTTKFWGRDYFAVKGPLTVGFLDNASPQLQKMILQYMNLWGKNSSVKFVQSTVDPIIRITRTPGEGYYSYLGTDALSVDPGQNTMNFDSFTVKTPISEFLRVVPHEGGHSLGLIHEHSRKQLEALINPVTAYPFYLQTQGWSHQDVDDQVLFVTDESEILLESEPDPTSIMCYPIPPQVTFNNKGIVGGVEINDRDYLTIGILYPSAA